MEETKKEQFEEKPTTDLWVSMFKTPNDKMYFEDVLDVAIRNVGPVFLKSLQSEIPTEHLAGLDIIKSLFISKQQGFENMARFTPEDITACFNVMVEINYLYTILAAYMTEETCLMMRALIDELASADEIKDKLEEAYPSTAEVEMNADNLDNLLLGTVWATNKLSKETYVCNKMKIVSQVASAFGESNGKAIERIRASDDEYQIELSDCFVSFEPWRA